MLYQLIVLFVSKRCYSRLASVDAVEFHPLIRYSNDFNHSRAVTKSNRVRIPFGSSSSQRQTSARVTWAHTGSGTMVFWQILMLHGIANHRALCHVERRINIFDNGVDIGAS